MLQKIGSYFINLNEVKMISMNNNENTVTIYFSDSLQISFDAASIEDKNNIEKLLKKGKQRWLTINNKCEK